MDLFKSESVLECFTSIFQVFLEIKTGINIYIKVEEIHFKSLKLILLHWKVDEVHGREKIIAKFAVLYFFLLECEYRLLVRALKADRMHLEIFKLLLDLHLKKSRT